MEQIMPLVSVIILTRNRPEYLVRAINSVLTQTFTDFEIIIIDDASTDDTPEVIKSFHDPRIISIRNNVNRGEAGSRNQGVNAAKGEFVSFLDDDDEWLPRKLDAQVNKFKNSKKETGCIYTWHCRVDLQTGEKIKETKYQKNGNIFKEMFEGNWVGTPSTVMVKKECFQLVGGFDESIGFSTDYDMWIRISKEFNIEYIGETLVNYGVHNKNMSTNLSHLIKGWERFGEKYQEWLKFYRKSGKIFHYRLGVLYCCQGEMKKGIEALRCAIRLYPFDMGVYYNLFLAMLGYNSFIRIKRYRERCFAKLPLTN